MTQFNKINTQVLVNGPVIANSLILRNTVPIVKILDEDNMISDSPSALATQRSIKTYIDNEIIGAGDVDGPASSTSNAIVRFNGTSGKLIKNSTAILDDAGLLSTTSTNIGATVQINATLDEDNMSSDRNDALATQQSIKAYVDNTAVGNVKFTGPVPVDNALARYDGATGTFIQSSSATLSDGGLLNPTMFTVNTTQTVNNISNDPTLAANSSVTLSTQQAIKTYVDSVATGLTIKESVVVATVVAGTLATDFENGDTVDGIVLATGDRILIKNQADPVENGIYIVAVAGAPARSADMANGSNAAGSLMFVNSGTVNGGTSWVCTNTAGSDVVGTDPLMFTQFSASNTITAGDGLSQVGNAFNVNVDDVTIEIVANDLTAKLIPVSKGGTGVTTLTSGNVLVGNGVGTVLTTKVAPTGAFVGTTDTQVLTNKTITSSTNSVTARFLGTPGADVNIATNSPTFGQILTATSATNATWQNATGGGNVTGPGSSTDRAIATWNGTTGTALFNNSPIINASGQVIGINGIAGTPSFTVSGSTNTGMYVNTLGPSVVFTTGGVNQLTLSASGSTLESNQLILPSGSLSVGSSATINGQVIGSASSNATNPSYSFSGDLNTGMFRSSADVLGLSTAGTNHMLFNGLTPGSETATLSKGSLLVPLGSATNAAVGFTSFPNTGLVSNAGSLDLYCLGNLAFNIGSNMTNCHKLSMSSGFQLPHTEVSQTTSIVTTVVANNFSGTITMFDRFAGSAQFILQNSIITTTSIILLQPTITEATSGFACASIVSKSAGSCKINYYIDLINPTNLPKLDFVIIVNT